jgi:hypothetical protein
VKQGVPATAASLQRKVRGSGVRFLFQRVRVLALRVPTRTTPKDFTSTIDAIQGPNEYRSS